MSLRAKQLGFVIVSLVNGDIVLKSSEIVEMININIWEQLFAFIQSRHDWTGFFVVRLGTHTQYCIS